MLIGLEGKYNQIPPKSSCQKPYDMLNFLLSSTNKVAQLEFPVIEVNGLINCITLNNINFRNLTFRISPAYSTSTSWSADIDNFEIAFDYTPPATTPTPVEFPENQRGTVWEIGPDKSNLRQFSGIDNVVKVTNGYNHSLALKTDGTVWAWGNNSDGQLGIGEFGIEKENPVQVMGESGEGVLDQVDQIAAGNEYSMALKKDGTVWVWGNNSDGLRGVGFGVNDYGNKLLYPTQIRSGHFQDVIKIAAGAYHTLVLNQDGSMLGWGRNNKGQVGNICYRCFVLRSPVKLPSIEDVVDIAVGGEYSLAVKNDGTLWGWGRTSEYQLARNATITVPSGRSEWFTPVRIIEIDDAKNVHSFLTSSYAVKNNGDIFEWGGNAFLGIPRKVNVSSSQSQVSVGFPSYSPGINGHVIKDNGTLWELYINEIPAKQVPVLKNVTDVASGYLTPALAVVNGSGEVLGDSTVAPFLRLPWDYEGQDRDFDDIVYDPESWFDHKYPLQNIKCCTFEVFKFDGQEVADAYRSHSGYDYASRNGVGLNTPVLAAAGGTATFRSEANTNGAGNEIKIDHGNGYQTWYQHLALDGLVVSSEGSTVEVEKGQKIGLVGMSGATNGPHIHFSVFKDENENSDFGDDYPFGLTDPLGWDGEQVDPWTEYDVGGRKGVESFKLFEKLQKSKKEGVSVSGGKVKRNFLELLFPSGWSALDLTVEIKDGPFESQSATFRSVAPSFFMTAVNSLGEKVTEFLKPIVITYNYANVDLKNIEEDSLRIMHYNPSSKTWVELASEIDTKLKEITAETSSFSQFALMGELKDVIAPTTEIILGGESGEKNIFRSTVNISFTAKDNEGGFGVKDTIFGVNDEEWQYFLEPFAIVDEGEHEVSYQSTDLVGYEEEVMTAKFVIDKTSPVSVIDVEGKEGENGWYVGNPTVTLSATDNLSGVSKIEYSLDEGYSFESYANPFEIDKEGEVDILYRSIDKAGNIEEAKNASVKIDKTAPVSKIYISGSKGQDNWYRSNVSLELSGNDNYSGYAGSVYSTNGGESFLGYIDTLIFADEGKHEVIYYSIDFAGNKEEAKTLVFSIDNTAPMVTISADPSKLWPPNGKMVTVKVNGSIDEAHLLNTKFEVIDEYGKIEPVLTRFGQMIKLEAKRNGNDRDGRVYTVNALAEDLAGNTGSATTKILVPHDRK